MTYKTYRGGGLLGLRVVSLVAALAGAQAWAVNKCTGPDGGITYQEAACPSSAKDSTRIAAQANGVSDAASGLWRFRREHDDMMQKVSCLVLSPITFPVKPVPKGFYPVHAVLVVGADGRPVFGLRTSDNSISFHNDLSGMGVKTGMGAFVALAVKSGSHVVAPADGAAVVAELEKTRELQARVRFWPYEQLYDLKPIPMDGYHSALSQALRCAQVQK